MKYIHLTTELRCQINTLLSIGMAQKAIAFYIGVSASTISRELKRNSGLRGYRSQPADLKAASRRSLASRRPRRMTAAMIHIVESKLIEKWSPEQIAGVLRSNGIKISYETIYRHIWADKRAGGTLYTHLRRKGKKYNHRGAKNAGRGCIPNRVDITSRPKIIDRKGRIGDWEGDTIIGAKMQGVILSLVDRKSKYTLLAAMEGKFAEQVPELVLRCLERLPKKRKGYSITFDNGKEFSKHEIITKKTGLLCYFATPYRSWERGLNEHTNGLVRQYFPKNSNLNLYSASDIQHVEDLLNNRPRKVLGYKTPKEVYLGIRRPQKIALGG